MNCMTTSMIFFFSKIDDNIVKNDSRIFESHILFRATKKNKKKMGFFSEVRVRGFFLWEHHIFEFLYFLFFQILVVKLIELWVSESRRSAHGLIKVCASSRRRA